MKRIVALALLFAGLVNLSKAKPVQPLALGSEAIPFSLEGVDGKTYTLESFKDAKALVVLFTCNHCPDARAARGRVKQMYADYKDKGVSLVAISGNVPEGLRLDELGWSIYGDSFEEMKIVAQEEGYEFPYLYDGVTQETTRSYGAVATPHAFVFDAERKLRYVGRLDDARYKPGPVDKSYIRNAIDDILAGKEVREPNTRAFGCSIKWKAKSSAVENDNKVWASHEVLLDDLTTGKAKALAANSSKKLRLINFWSTTCAPCVAEFPDLVELYRRYQNRPFEFVSISQDPYEEKEKVHAFLKKKHAALSPRTIESVKEEGRMANNYIIAETNADPIAEAIDAQWTGALPYTLLVAPGGEVLFRKEGKIDELELRREIMKYMDAL